MKRVFKSLAAGVVYTLGAFVMILIIENAKTYLHDHGGSAESVIVTFASCAVLIAVADYFLKRKG